MTVQVKAGKNEWMETEAAEFIRDLVQQVRSNNFQLYPKKTIVIKGWEHRMTATVGYRKLNPRTIPNWNVPPYVGNGSYVLATFKLKYDGNHICNLSITVRDVTEGCHNEVAREFVKGTLGKEATLVKETLNQLAEEMHPGNKLIAKVIDAERIDNTRHRRKC